MLLKLVKIMARDDDDKCPYCSHLVDELDGKLFDA